MKTTAVMEDARTAPQPAHGGDTGANGEESSVHGRYEELASRVNRLGAWLSGPDAPTGPRWDAAFARYREQAARLRRLGDQLRPVSLRDRSEPLTGVALADEVLELFAA